MNNSSRRTYLKGIGAAGAIFSSAGCLSWIRGERGEGSGENQEPFVEDGDPPTENDTVESTREETATRDTENESTDTDGNKSTEENESEENTEADLHPDENETQHTGDYEESASGQQRETEPRPTSNIEITDTAATMNARGGVTYRATVTNVSDEPIDAIDIYVDYTAGGEYAYGDSIVVRDLDAGASETVKSTAPAGRVGGNPEDIRVTISEVKPYDYTSSGS